MTDGEIQRATEDTLGPIVEAVRLTTLGLLASLPQHPKRLRVHAAGVTVDLDWRSSPGPAPHVEQGEQRAMVVAPTGVQVIDEPPSDSYFVCAPAVGTFYHAPDPGRPPFVAAGELVEVGRQVGIVEAMKLMLPVEADRAGRVVEVLVPDGQAVEYGQRLLELRPADSE
jgi:acetyl-CoA carboxylase biotin carboxyl carrier protein